LLDYGTVTGPQGITFTGFIAAVRDYDETMPELALDSGTLTQPDGRVFTGEFSILYQEGSVLLFSKISDEGVQLQFSLSPHIFRGTISSGNTIDPYYTPDSQIEWAVESFLNHQIPTDVIQKKPVKCVNCKKIGILILSSLHYLTYAFWLSQAIQGKLNLAVMIPVMLFWISGMMVIALAPLWTSFLSMDQF
jgi:hypothetical protein